MERVTEKARAKLNLTMEVGERRPDGYHLIRSVMAFVELWDLVELEKAPAFSFRCSDPALDGPDNLAARAYGAMAERYPVGPVSIRLTKRIPCQSGMGGGSADAAAVLRGLDRLFGLGLPREELCRVGQSLGADVPACVLGGGVYARGIGERVEPFPLGEVWAVAVKPPASFSTPRMYARLDRCPGERPPGDHRAMMAALEAGDAGRAAGLLMNHFEGAAEDPGEIARAKAALLEAGALGASMTGAGSAVFGLFPGEGEAREARERLSREGHEAFLCPAARGGDAL